MESLSLQNGRCIFVLLAGVIGYAICIGMLMSFVVTSYDTTTLFLGEDVNSPEKWRKAIESLLFGLLSAEEQSGEMLTKADVS